MVFEVIDLCKVVLINENLIIKVIINEIKVKDKVCMVMKVVVVNVTNMDVINIKVI